MLNLQANLNLNNDVSTTNRLRSRCDSLLIQAANELNPIRKADITSHAQSVRREILNSDQKIQAHRQKLFIMEGEVIPVGSLITSGNALQALTLFMSNSRATGSIDFDELRALILRYRYLHHRDNLYLINPLSPKHLLSQRITDDNTVRLIELLFNGQGNIFVNEFNEAIIEAEKLILPRSKECFEQLLIRSLNK